MRRFLVVVLVGCHSPPPPVAAAEPPCVPALETRIAQLHDVREPLPEGVSPADALDALAATLTASGVVIEAVDRGAQRIATAPFAGETIAWTCDMREYREYRYRVAVVGDAWTVGLDCRRAYGWAAHQVGDKLVPAETGVLLACPDSAQYTTPLDAHRSKVIAATARKRLQRGDAASQ